MAVLTVTINAAEPYAPLFLDRFFPGEDSFPALSFSFCFDAFGLINFFRIPNL
jgi:hypothetical protein